MRLGLLAAAAATLAATDAFAESPPSFASQYLGWYVAADVGYHAPAAINSHSTGLAPDGRPYDWRWQAASDYAGFLRFGYRFTPHFRAELETSYENSSLKSVHEPGDFSGGSSTSRPGEPWGLCSVASAPGQCISPAKASNNWTWMWSGTANVIFDILPESRIDPFVGVGVGFSHVEWPSTFKFSNVPGQISPDNPAVQTLKGAGTLNRTSQLSVVAIAGLSYRATSRVRVDLTYRDYFTPSDLDWDPANTTPGLPLKKGLRPGDFLGKFEDQSMTVGLRYAF